MSAIPLSTWANIAEILGAGGLVFGLVFGLFQIRQYRAQQRGAIAINLAQTFYSRDLARAIALLKELPDGIGLEELRQRGGEWFEWLADQAAAVKHADEPAHIRFRDWKP